MSDKKGKKGGRLYPSRRAEKSVDFKRPPEDFFFTPGRDPGLHVLDGAPPRYELKEPAIVRGFAISDHDNINAEIEKAIRFSKRAKTADKTLVLKPLQVVLENCRAQESFRSVGGKWLLSGPAGTRLRNKFAIQNATPGVEPHAAACEFFLSARPGCVLPPYEGPPLPGDLPYVIECRNRFNFFHFLTETLCQLCSAAEAPTTGPIFIHYPGGKKAAFTRNFVDALFPDIAERVQFRSRGTNYPQALSSYEIDHFIFQAEDGTLPSIDPVMPENWIGKDRMPGPQAQAILAQNAVNEDLIKLRTRAHAIVAKGDYSHLPRRFWVARSATGARDRQMLNERKLVRQLEKIGFETVYFEEMSPLEQVAIMANAEMMISYHGAGFANLIFAGDAAHVIEIGHLQSAIYRWSDFIQLAHVAGCKYTSFFADFNKEDPHVIPPVRHKGLLPVAISDAGIDQLVGFVANALAERKRSTADGDIGRVAARLNETQEWAGLRDLLDRNMETVEADPTLLVYLANCANAEKRPLEMRRWLEASWALDPTRPIVLERLIRLARRRKEWGKAQALLAEHKTRFPERDSDFTGKPLNRP